MLDKIANIGRTYRHMQRYREILSVLFKYGFGDLVDSLRIEHSARAGGRILGHWLCRTRMDLRICGSQPKGKS